MRTLAITLFLAVLAGCHHPHGHHHQDDRAYPVIYGIEVYEHDNIGTALEIEVHLYDAHSGELLACSGNDDGLDFVNEAHVRYRTHATFVRPYDGYHRLYQRHLDGRDLYLRVYEDDLEPCPTPPGSNDDFVGQSPVFAGEDLYRGITMSFDDVPYLRLGVGY